LPAGAEGDAVRRSVATSHAADELECRELGPAEFAKALALLEQAAISRVPGAAIDFANEGPFGDLNALVTRPDDPLVKDWRSRAIGYLESSASAGHVDSLSTLSMIYSSGRDAERNPKTALMYQVAYAQARAAGGQGAANEAKATDRLSKGLSAEDVARATEEGKALAERCCARR
jgi:hypothetical protein